VEANDRERQLAMVWLGEWDKYFSQGEWDALAALLARYGAEQRLEERHRVNAIWREATTRILNNPVLSIELNSFIEQYWLAAAHPVRGGGENG